MSANLQKQCIYLQTFTHTPEDTFLKNLLQFIRKFVKQLKI